MNHKFKNFIFPMLIMLLLPMMLIYLIYYTSNFKNLSINIFSISTFITLIIYGYLSIILSKKKFKGPKNIDDVEPEYAANGNEFYITTIFLTLLILYFNKDFSDLFVQNFLPITLTFTIFGYIFVSYLYLTYKNNYFDKEKDDSSELFKFYRGLQIHPKLFGVDIKQLTNCRFGMISWQIFIIIFCHYYFQKKEINYPIFFSVILQSIYIAKFFYWETGYFNTLDITLDRAGFYICWGCLVFVPCFYTFTTYYMINNNPSISLNKSIIIFILGLYFTYKNYEVDWQKQKFQEIGEEMKINNEKVKCMKLFNTYKNKDSKFLLSGHWGYARHTNYTYEILLSLCWSLFGYDTGILVFSYVFYIITLLVHRIKRDQNKCLDKYGDDYKKYMEKVPYKLIKNVY